MRFLTSSCVALAVASSALAQNQAASFQVDTTSQIDVAASPFLVPKTGLTVEAWITYDDSTIPVGGGDKYPSICRHTTTLGTSASYIFRVDALSSSARNLSFIVNSNGFGLGAASASFAAGEFSVPTHVAGTFDGQNYAVYINGVLRASAAFPGIGTIVDAGGDLVIGNGGDGVVTTEATWNGTIDELRIWPFARSEVEINETMNDSLVAVPGSLSFNLDGNGDDSSQGLVGIVSPAVTFVPGTSLPFIALGSSVFGSPTTSCSNGLGVATGSSTRAGNAGFEVVCYDAAPSTIGLCVFAFTPLASAVPVLGFDLWVDPSAVVTFLAQADAAGVARVPLSLAGASAGPSLAAQFVFIDPICGPSGFSSSGGVSFMVQ